MSTSTTSRQKPYSNASVDHGLRSVQGIRWLLFAGGLVVAVSVIRLVAAEWGVLPTAARFLTLVAGALAVFAAGEVTRNRLRLPVAGSALLFLGATLVPLLAWGAAYLGLLEAPFGWPCLGLGLGALLAATDRTVRQILGYRGGYFTLASGVLLFALPVLPYLAARWPWSPDFFFLLAAGALGLLLRSASRHVNRFFFHRDRLSGVERPIHGLPFVLLVLLYLGGMSLLPAFASHLALPLVFVAIALLDAGEEYYRAQVRATGEKPERWPRRSLALLALGFSTLAASLATSPFDAGRHSLALVASIASLRLLAWASRYRSTLAHTCGLLVGVVAYHAFPVLVPEVVRDLFTSAIQALGVDPRGPGAFSLGDLGMVAQLLALAWFLRWRLTPAMRMAHAVVTAGCASLLLLVGLMDPSASRIVAPAAAILLAAGVLALRWKALVPALYQALATAALAWAWSPGLAGAAWSARSALLLGIVHIVYLGAGYLLLRRYGERASRYVTPRLLTWPPLAVGFALLLRAWLLAGHHWASTGLLILVAAGTFLLSALILGRTWLLIAALASAFVWVPVQAAGFATGIAPTLAAAGWLALAVGLRALAEISERRGHTALVPTFVTAAMIGGAAAGAAAIWGTATAAAGSPWLPILPGFMASLFFVFLAFQGSVEHRKLSAALATGYFALASTVLLFQLPDFGPELYCLGPGLALLGLSGLLRRELDERWRLWLFTGGATLLYAMPVLGLLEELTWGWQIVLLLLAVAFGAASFRLRSRSLLIVSTAALVVDLACFLIKLRQTAPLLVWVAGIVFGLGLMAIAALLEPRRAVLLPRIRLWGQVLRSWA